MFSRLFGFRVGRAQSVDSEIDDHPTIYECRIEVENLKEHIDKLQTHQQSLSEAKLLAERKAEQYFRALGRLEKQLRASEKAQLFGNEKIRRLSELLQNANETSANIRRENNILTSNIAVLQTGIQTLTDDEVDKEMTILYHDIEQWILKHSRASLAAKPEIEFLNAEDPAVAEMQSKVSVLIHQNFWNSEFVGYGTQYNQYMTAITNAIGNKCPSHMLQHWRFATSTGALDLGTPNLMAQCDLITQQVGNNRDLTATETSQLKEILSRCIELKARLEYQGARYTFWIHIADSLFHSENMRNPLKENAAGEVVEYTLWPAIYKEAENGLLVVHKAVVRTVPPHT